MTRITLWFIHARDAVALVLTAMLSGCLSYDTREAPPPLVITPQSAVQGDLLPLILSAEGLDFKTCSDDPSALVFKGPSRHPVLVHRIDDLLYEQSGSRAYVTIDSEAIVGEYEVEYLCNDTTTLSGTFRIDPLPEELVLTVTDPASLSAGSFQQTLTLSTTAAFFREDTELRFGAGDVVTVKRKWLTTDAPSEEMMVEVDVDPLAPLGDMSLTAISGNRIARGTLTITDRIVASIDVTPKEVERQGTDDNQPRIYELAIRGEGIAFVAPNGPGDTDTAATQIDFPENVGINVVNGVSVHEVMIDGKPEAEVHATITVNDRAQLGGTPLHLTTGDREAWTQLSVLLPSGSVNLEVVSPKRIACNGKVVPAFAEAIKFDLKDFESLACLSDDCEVVNPVVDYNTFKKISFGLKVDKAFCETANEKKSSPIIELSLKTASHTVKADLEVEEPDTIQLALEDPGQVLRQGQQDPVGIRFILTGASFSKEDNNVTVEVLPRSGLKIVDRVISTSLDQLVVFFQVAEDAPVGPAYIKVVSNDLLLEAPIPIVAKDASVNQITCTPGATLRKRDIMLPEVRATGFTLPASPSAYAFDDPGLRIAGVRLTDSGTAALTVDVSPRARTDMAVLYVKSADGQAASTFRVLDYPQTKILTADPPIVSRGTTTTVTVQGEGVEFNLPVVEVVEDIGMKVTRISDEQYLVFDLQLDDVGYGGFTGLVVRNDSSTFLTMLQIEAGQDSSLTAKMTPQTVYPSYDVQEIALSIPTAMSIDESVLDVYSGLKSTYVAAPKPTSDHKVSFYLDVPYDVLDISSNEIPIFVTTPSGAATGFLKIAKEKPTRKEVGEMFDETITQGRTTNLEIIPGRPPTLVQVAFANGVGDGVAALIAKNGLDVAEKQKDGRLWIMDTDPALLALSADAEDNPVWVLAKSRGENAVDENLEVSSSTTAWTLGSTDLCETPFLGLGRIDGALDTDSIELGAISCELVAVVHARTLAHRPWDTPDLKMQLRNAEDALLSENTGGTDADPLLPLSPGLENVRIDMSGEMGSAGTYLVNIRRPHLIREISRQDTSFVELLIGPGDNLDTLTLTLIDADAGEEVTTLDLADADVAEGIMVISSGALQGANLVHPVALLPRPGEGSFALVLKQGETVIDAVQVGVGGMNQLFGETAPIAAGPNDEVFFRMADIDTNDNDADFMVGFVATPGY